MASRRRISYQWQLFIPLVTVLWLTIFGMAYWQFDKEREYRKEQINSQLELINSFILDAYNRDIDIKSFVKFLANYYRENPLYDQIRVSIYKDGELTSSTGEPIGLSDSEQLMGQGLTRTPEIGRMPEDAIDTDRYFFYNRSISDDGRVVVYTVLPFDTDVDEAVLPSGDALWFVLGIALAMTIFAYVSTRYYGRNIKALRSVAQRAANDPKFIPVMNVPHDELGDITRQITQLYNDRSQAMQRLQQEHRVALHAIEEKAKAKRQLTNNINHELRTPIGVIKGYLDTILDTPDMDEGSRTHFLRKAQEHVERLVNLIADVSAITRLEDGGEMVATEELDYHDVVYTIANDLEESGVMDKMEFKFNIPFECKVTGNYNLLAGMITNLAKNSANYSKGTLCELNLVGEDDKFYYFEFRDNGKGVGEEHLPHLFERFYRIDSGRSRKAGGTGLGLPIVQNTILAHGGTIEVYNGATGGLAFKYSLPKLK